MDKYDKQIKRLRAKPELIAMEWLFCQGIFQFANKSGRPEIAQQHGCLTMIRGMRYVAETPELTEAIRSDERIPTIDAEITVKHLARFAFWQRLLDRTIRRKRAKSQRGGAR